MNLVNLIDSHLLEDEQVNTLYETSPFKTIRNLPTATKGKRYEAITTNVLCKMGYEVELSHSNEFDRYIDGSRVELKGSTLAADMKFKFHQIRLDDEYDELVVACFWPLDLRLFKIKKEDIWMSGMVASDHGGGRSNTRMIKLIGDPSDCQYFTEVRSKVNSPIKGALK